MEYFDRYDNKYVSALKSGRIIYHTRIIALNWQEQGLMDLTDKTDLKNSSVTIQNTNPRRKATLKLINTDNSLDVNENKLLWYMRKFQIFKGVEAGGDIYWFSLGIYVVTDISGTERSPVVSLSDKYSLLNGDIKLTYTEAELQIPSSGELELLSDEAIAQGKGIMFINVIRELLQQPLGNGYILDDKEPVADPEFDKLFIHKQCVISAGFYPAAVIEELSQTNMYNAYYNTYGHLKIERNLSDDYYYLAPIFDFTRGEHSPLTTDYKFTQTFNSQTVTGSDVDGNIYYYTARNDNPRSPVRISLIGERRDKQVSISNGNSERRCEMYAKYLLKQKTAPKLSVSFESTVIPHIDADRPILIDGEKFIVQSADFPLSGGSMKISACSIDYIPYEEQG